MECLQLNDPKQAYQIATIDYDAACFHCSNRSVDLHEALMEVHHFFRAIETSAFDSTREDLLR